MLEAVSPATTNTMRTSIPISIATLLDSLIHLLHSLAPDREYPAAQGWQRFPVYPE